MENSKDKDRYTTLKNYQGIRKDNKTGKFIVTKCIKGKRSFKSFSSLREASGWKNSFHPGVPQQSKVIAAEIEKINGDRTTKTLKDVWELYQELHLLGLEKSSQESCKYLATIFNNLLELPINKIVPEIIDKNLSLQKEFMISTKAKRCNFTAPLKFLRSLFSWYKENYDFSFVNPIMKRHFSLGKIKEPKQKEKRLSAEDILKFFEALPRLLSR
ncbi:MAG: hypothetical protein U0T83_07770 [Bacteriovoracaceae bacterium]